MSRQQHLSLEQSEAFDRAMNAYPQVKNSPEAAKAFFESIDQQLRGKEILVATHKTASHFLDEYIKECPINSLHSLLSIFSNRIDELCFDQCASHCVEGVTKQAVQFIDSKDFKPSFGELFKNLITNLNSQNVGIEYLAEDRNGSHVLRTLISELSENKSLNQFVEKKLIRPVIQILVKSPEKSKIAQFSAVLQTIAKLNFEKNEKVVKYLATSIPMDMSSVSDRQASKIVEEVIKLGLPDPIEKAYTNVFKDNALNTARHPIANYVLQRWLEQCNAEMFEGVCKSLLPNFVSILDDKSDVAVAICNAAARLEKQQDNIIDILNKFRDGKNIIDALMGIRKEKCGAQILQAICRFQQKQANTIVGGFLDLSEERLQNLCVSKTGTFVVTEYLRSDLKKGRKMKLVDRLIPILPNIAGDRAGSYIVEDAFKCSDMDKKVEICEKIASVPKLKEEAPNTWRSLKIDSFMSRRGQWEHEIKKLNAVNNDFMKDILESKPAKPNVKTTQKDTEEGERHHKHRHHTTQE